MSCLRPLALILLTVALLPWGAYARSFAPHTDPAVTEAAQVAVAQAERPCRGAALPGSPCGPDLFLGVPETEPETAGAAARFEAQAAETREGLSPRAVRGPPKRV